jgi:1A family penicillin-binding protein
MDAKPVEADGKGGAPGRLPPPPQPPRTRREKLARAAMYALALGVGAGVAGASWWQSCGYRGCPTIAQLQAWGPSEGGRLLDHTGTLISPLTPVRRTNVPLASVPKHVRATFIAVEDRRFYEHEGIDWKGAARATVANLKAGGVREGGSTISMQLARNAFLVDRAQERSFTRKLLEIRYAKLLEQALTKDQILENYLNAIYLGNRVYGVEGASRDLFGKGVGDLTLAEAAMLAGLPKAPSGYSPRRDRARALARREVVFSVLERDSVMPPDALARARATPLKVVRASWEPARNVDSWAAEAVRSVLDSLRKAGAIPAGLADANLVVHSTFDRRAQLAGERAVGWGAAQVDGERDDRGGRTQGALVAVDPATGAIRALVGGRRVERGGFNRALRAQRQPGSAFKPFVYAAAIMHGFTPATMVEDVPVSIGSGQTLWTPANYSDDYAGRVTLRDALRRSANAATVRVSRDVGITTVAEQAQAQGITSTLPLVPALALGAGGVTPLELTTAYAPFANGGTRVTPYMIERVEDNFGRVIWAHGGGSTSQALESTDAFLVTSMLRSVVDNGTGRAVRSAGIRGPVAGKTGTTNDGADVWFVGYTPSIVAGVWFGADDPVPLGAAASGGRFAAPAWARFIKDGWHSPEEDGDWEVPMGIEHKWIDIGTGKLASDWCGPSRKEYFRVGTTPTESCETDQRIAMWDTLGVQDWADVIPPPDSMRVIAPPDSLHQLGMAVEAVGAMLHSLQTSEKARTTSRRVVAELRETISRETRRTRDLERRVARRLSEERERQVERTERMARKLAEGRRGSRE